MQYRNSIIGQEWVEDAHILGLLKGDVGQI